MDVWILISILWTFSNLWYTVSFPFLYINIPLICCLYLFGILFPPWSEQSGCLVWRYTEKELTLRIPAEVQDCIKVTWYYNPRPPASLVTHHCTGQFKIFSFLLLNLALYTVYSLSMNNITCGMVTHNTALRLGDDMKICIGEVTFFSTLQNV